MSAAPKVPPLAACEQPGLSETLTGPVAPDRCQSCGAAPPDIAGDVDYVLKRQGYARLERWVECDPSDQPTAVVVVLCARCSKRLIDAHPRLYIALSPDEPRPGCMTFCLECAHREGTRCTHPDAKANGGTGVRLGFDHKPSRMHVCGGRRGGGCRVVTVYGRVTRCRQKLPIQEVRDG